MTAFSNLLNRVRDTSPLVHCISNLVTANDCANLVLAAGASPIMADAPEEVEEITALSRALCLSLEWMRWEAVFRRERRPESLDRFGKEKFL